MIIASAIARRALLFFLPLAAGVVVILFLIYRAQVDAATTVIRANEGTLVELASEIIRSELFSVGSDLLFLSEHNPLHRWLAGDTSETREALVRTYIAFAGSKTIYDQVRFIDLFGQEIIRVDWNRGRPVAARDDQLQNKADRHYVKETLTLPRGQLYQSVFDLNVERGKIEQPPKPVIRFATPVFDSTGMKRGIVIVNFLGERLLERVRALALDQPGSISLLNSEGYWLLGPNAEDNWAFMYPERKSRSFAERNPEIWERIRSGSAPPQFHADGDLYTYQWILPRERVANIQSAANRWVILGHQSKAVIDDQTDAIGRSFIAIGFLFITLLAGISWILARHQITRKELNERLKRDNAELAAVNKELEAFSYSVSHDLRAPLRAIDGFSRTLLEDYGDRLEENGMADLMRVRTAAQRMGILIDDLLKLAHVTRSEIKVDDIDLSALASEIVTELKQTSPQREGEFIIAPSLRAQGDCRLLRIALENLLANAWKFTAKRSPARIEFGRTNANGSSAYFVRDNGVGFDMDYADKLFGAFQRLHDAREFPGTGIGLATVQRIVRKHGGIVWADAVADRGATFYFTL